MLFVDELLWIYIWVIYEVVICEFISIYYGSY